jgi:hypothetical protein
LDGKVRLQLGRHEVDVVQVDAAAAAAAGAAAAAATAAAAALLLSALLGGFLGHPLQPLLQPVITTAGQLESTCTWHFDTGAKPQHTSTCGAPRNKAPMGGKSYPK